MKTIGQIAFEAYNEAKGGVTYDGKPIPPWTDVGDAVRTAWECAAGAAAGTVQAEMALSISGMTEQLNARIDELDAQLAIARELASERLTIAAGAALLMREVICEKIYRERARWDAEHPNRALGIRHVPAVPIAAQRSAAAALGMDSAALRLEAARILDELDATNIVDAEVKAVTGPWVGEHRGREVTTTDGQPPELPVDEASAPKPVGPDGQHRSYWVLSEAERAKGFVRSVRTTYLHKPCGTTTTMGRALAETYAREPSFYSHTFCVRCGGHRPVAEFTWDGTEEVVGS